MIPAGTYRAQARDAEYGYTNSGNEFIRVNFIVTDGQFQGERVEWNGYFSPKTTQRTLESLQFCGCTFPNNDPTDLSGLDTREVSIVVEHETYTNKQGQEKTYAKVRWVNSLSRGITPEVKMDVARKIEFKQRMAGHVMALKQGAAGQAQSADGPSSAEPSHGVDDDIPF